MKISVVVCCYNSSTRLPETLAALGAQVTPPGLSWELIVVDNNSSDDTAATASRLWTREDVVLRVLSELRQGQMWARIAGISSAKGEIVACVDDDNSLAPDYISRVVKIFSEHPEVGAVGGQGIGVYESGLPVWMNESLSCSIAIGPQLPAGGYVPWNRGYLYGAGLCFRRSIWIELQSIGWEPFAFGRAGSGTTGSQLLLSGDDIELCLAVQALGYRLYYEPALSFKHHIPSARLQWSYWLRLYEGFGATNCAIAVLRARLRPDRSPVRRGMELLARMVYAQLHRPFRRFWSQRARRRSEGDLLALREVAKAGYAIAATTIFWSALRAKWPACIKSKKRG